MGTAHEIAGNPMTPPRIVQDFRPDEIIIGYWRQALDIGQNDDVLPVEILMEDANEDL